MRYNTCYHVLRNVGSPYSEGDNSLIFQHESYLQPHSFDTSVQLIHMQHADLPLSSEVAFQTSTDILNSIFVFYIQKGLSFVFLVSLYRRAYINLRIIVPGTCIEQVFTIIGTMAYWGCRTGYCSLGNFVISIIFIDFIYMYRSSIFTNKVLNFIFLTYASFLKKKPLLISYFMTYTVINLTTL